MITTKDNARQCDEHWRALVGRGVRAGLII